MRNCLEFIPRDPIAGSGKDNASQRRQDQSEYDHRTQSGSSRRVGAGRRADLDNQRKRLTRDVEMARKFANERLLSALLPVIDSLEAGLQAASGDALALREGVELTLKQLLKVTGDNGLVEVNPAGQPFNPEHHQAMSTVPSAEHPPGHVVQVYQKGWLLNERLLRPALVLVSGDA